MSNPYDMPPGYDPGPYNQFQSQGGMGAGQDRISRTTKIGCAIAAMILLIPPIFLFLMFIIGSIAGGSEESDSIATSSTTSSETTEESSATPNLNRQSSTSRAPREETRESRSSRSTPPKPPPPPKPKKPKPQDGLFRDDQGIGFPGKGSLDVGAHPNKTLVKKGVHVSTSPLRIADGLFSEKIACTTVMIKNKSDSKHRFSPYDWELQSPGGVIESPSLITPGKSLDSATLAPGGAADGEVCFDNPLQVGGTYVVLYEAGFWSGQRFGWVNNR